MKQIKINKLLKVVIVFSMILGLSLPVAKASVINSDTVDNGNSVTDSGTLFFSFLSTMVEFNNQQAVTLVYDATFPVAGGANEIFGLQVVNRTGVDWTHLSVEFIGLASTLDIGTLLHEVNDRWATGTSNQSTTFPGFEAEFTAFIHPDPSDGGVTHFMLDGAINNFKNLQGGNPFSIRITPTGTVAHTPIPAAAWLFATGILTLFGSGMQKRRVGKTAA